MCSHRSRSLTGGWQNIEDNYIGHSIHLQPTNILTHQLLQGRLPPEPGDTGDALEIDVFIGFDLYWNMVTGRMQQGRNEPMAIHTKIGWDPGADSENGRGAQLEIVAYVSAQFTLNVQ